MYRDLEGGIAGRAQRRLAALFAQRVFRAFERNEDGVSLIDVTVASAILMVVLIPVAFLMINSTQTIANASTVRAASTVAGEQLTSLQSEVTKTYPPTGLNASTATPAAWPTAAQCTTTPSLCPTPSVNGVAYHVYSAGGWCVLSGGAWGGTASSPLTVTSNISPTYHVVVKVAWGLGASSGSTTNDLVDPVELAGNTQTSAPAVGTSVQSCPLALS